MHSYIQNKGVIEKGNITMLEMAFIFTTLINLDQCVDSK